MPFAISDVVAIDIGADEVLLNVPLLPYMLVPVLLGGCAPDE